MAVSRAGGLHLQPVHDQLLTGVYAQLILPALSDGLASDDNLDLLRRGRVRPAIAAVALAVEDPHSDALRTAEPDFLREVTAVIHEGHADPQALSVSEAVHALHQLIQLGPDLRRIGPAQDDPAPDAPVFLPEAPADDLILKAVILHVHAHGQHQDAVRQLCGVFLASGHVVILVGQAAAVFPQLPEQGVVDHLQLLCIAPGFQILRDDLLPAHPGRTEGVQPERPNAVAQRFRIFRNPLRVSTLHVVLFGDPSAFRADVVDLRHDVGNLVIHLGLVKLIPDILPADVVVLSAVRTLGAPSLLGAVLKRLLNRGKALDGWR